MDNEPAFTGKALDQWACERSVNLHFIDPGKPVQHAFIESFNGKSREECSNECWFTSLEHAHHDIPSRRSDYNHVRPHKSLGWKTPDDVERAASCPPWRPSGYSSSLAERSELRSPTYHRAWIPNF